MSPPSDRLHVFFPVVQPACVCLRSRSGLASGLVLTEAGGCLRWISSSSKVEVWGDLVILVRADSSTLTPCELMACFVPRAVRRRQQCDLPAFVEHFCIFIFIFLNIPRLCVTRLETPRGILWDWPGARRIWASLCGSLLCCFQMWRRFCPVFTQGLSPVLSVGHVLFKRCAASWITGPWTGRMGTGCVTRLLTQRHWETAQKTSDMWFWYCLMVSDESKILPR